MRYFLFILLGTGLILTPSSHGRGLTPFVYPSAAPFSSVQLPVFPGPGAMGMANASAMTAGEQLNHFTFANSIPMDGSQQYGVQGAWTVSSKHLGFTAGYVGTIDATTTHGYFAALSARLGKLSVGAGMSQSPVGTDGPSADLSITIPMLETMAFTTVFRDVAGGAKPSFGVGYRGEFTQFQAFVDLPNFNDSDAGYRVGSALTFGWGMWSFHTALALQTLTKTSDYSVGLGRWFTKDFHLSIQYETLKRVTLGVELAL